MRTSIADKELRIALVMGGGVSLGTFSSGALAELCRLLERLQNHGHRRVVIDVATGASAGAMTLAVLFRYLYAGASVSTIRDAMQDCWVEGVGVDPVAIDRQLLPQMDRHNCGSLLSDRPLQALGQTHVLDYAGEAQGCDLLARTAYLSFSLSSLNGLDYRAPCQWSARDGCPVFEPGQDALVTTRFEDRIRFRLEKERRGPFLRVDPSDCARPVSGLSKDQWEPILDAALASGAFPGVFAPRKILRFKEEYPQGWPRELLSDAHTFTYVDGGMFMNEPLKEALGLAHRIDRGQDPAGYERLFLFVDPVVSGSSSQLVLASDLPQSWTSTYNPNGDCFSYKFQREGYIEKVQRDLGRVSDALFGQASYRDWMRLGATNQKVEWFSKLVELVGSHLHDIELPAKLVEGLEALAQEVVDSDEPYAPANERPAANHGFSPPSKVYRSDKDEQLREVAQAAPMASPVQHRAAADLQLVFERIAGLDHKRDVNVVAVSSRGVSNRTPVRLAGNFAGAFGGFFKQEWRQHDFEVGQEMMRRTLLENPLARALLALDKVGETYHLPAESRPSLRSGYDEVDPLVRERVESVMHEHIEAFLHSAGVPHFVDHLLARKLRRVVTRRLSEPGFSQVRRLQITIGGLAVQEGASLLGQSGEHDLAAFGSPPRLITTLESFYDPHASSVASSYRLHGPELHRDDESFVLHVRSGEGEAPVIKIRLLGSAQQWHERAAKHPWVDVCLLRGEAVHAVSPQGDWPGRQDLRQARF